MSSSFNPILYETEEVGKKVKVSKIKHSWIFEYYGRPYTVDYFYSRVSHKARAVLNEVEVFKGKRSKSDLTIALEIGRDPVMITHKGDQVDLRVGGVFFKHELARKQNEPQPEEPVYEDDFPDEEVIHYNIKTEQPAGPVKKTERWPDPVPKPKSDLAPTPKTVLATEPEKPKRDLLEDIFGGPSFPSVFPDDGKKTDFGSGKGPVSAEDDLMGPTIHPERKIGPETEAKQPQYPQYPQYPQFQSQYPGQYPMYPQMSGYPHLPNEFQAFQSAPQPSSVVPIRVSEPNPVPRSIQEPFVPIVSEAPVADFCTPHIGLVGSTPLISKNNPFSDKPQIISSGNPFAAQKSNKKDETFTTDQDIHRVVDLDNLHLGDMYSKPRQEQYQKQIESVKVPDSDPTIPMKDLQVKGPPPQISANPYVTGVQAQGQMGPMTYPNGMMMYPGQMQYPSGVAYMPGYPQPGVYMSSAPSYKK